MAIAGTVFAFIVGLVFLTVGLPLIVCKCSFVFATIVEYARTNSLHT